MSDAFDLPSYLDECRAAVNAALDAVLAMPEAGQPGADDPGRLREAMRYAVLQGGKRMRPVLTIAACQAAGGDTAHALPAACALEMIHAYSLVHDDLPAMDNDLERRGKPTVHVEFGHANAILVGDALLTDAFEVLARGTEGVPRANIADAVTILARCAGINGMVGGQALDLIAGQDIADLETLERVHALKTGGLYAAAGALGGLSSPTAAPEAATQLERYGLAFGIAFQHADDVLDDDQPSLRAEALARVDQLTAECRTIAEGFGEAGKALVAIADWVQARAKRAASGDLRDTV
ncbi:geranylgeranyl pyrophosphate synthase [Plesiocystis pacifica SIR-1]|uniref:Geranylgeranyl pyrophosphate synthase n=1 Tax=Plesiocystis pacifica SIR-1 TaxID=391625 RepID=A6GKD8_9BACT|nr:polyprenyl synthetase family protein [Plesiocystis pacifica]EDM73658.1 geranylgeranyl pyrophosphate synthase [Plesiocystis pacifica SIR-1]